MINKLVRNRKQDSQGFTLVEIMIAISIFTIGILAIASMQVSAINGNDSANNLTGATTWAQDKIEELLAIPYANLVGGGTDNQEIYTIRWRIDPCPNFIAGISYCPPSIPASVPNYLKRCPDINCTVPNTKVIIVTVDWQERGTVKYIWLTNAKPAV
jgi:prepilin-type N-terminal cleavage/methylation domain-containing protein